ncbi:unnamed protein product, partial [Adineta ricciae]
MVDEESTIISKLPRVVLHQMQSVIIVWLNEYIDTNDEYYQHTIAQLENVAHCINTFTDNDECIDFILTITDTRVFLIISESLIGSLMPCISDISHLDAIFVSSHAEQSGDTYTNECPKKSSIWWYTRESSLYSMLNRALRLMDCNIIVQMGFFINDLHRHIERLHKEQSASQSSSQIFTVYRGQGLSKLDFDQMVRVKGGLMSFNSFLSTSETRDIPLIRAESNASNLDLVGVLFTIQIHSTSSSTCFALIRNCSFFEDEDEVLFSMHSVFRIRDIKQIGTNNNLYEVSLVLTNDNDKELSMLTDFIRKESFPNLSGWHRLSLLLIKLNQNEKAQEITEVLLYESPGNMEKAQLYGHMSWIKANQGKYEQALEFGLKSFSIEQKARPRNHLDLASSYNNMGIIYVHIGDYSQAISFYEQTLAIHQNLLPSNHLQLAASYNNVGWVHDRTGNYSKALLSYKQALVIKEQSLPHNHPELGASYSNLGGAYNHMGKYREALTSYEKALEIQRQSLPRNHPELAISYNDIGSVYYNMGNYSKSLSLFEEALTIQLQSLSHDHPLLAIQYSNI